MSRHNIYKSLEKVETIRRHYKLLNISEEYLPSMTAHRPEKIGEGAGVVPTTTVSIRSYTPQFTGWAKRTPPPPHLRSNYA